MEAKSLTGKTGIIIFGKVSHTLIMLIIPIILTRFITKNEFGTYRQIFLILNILITIFVLGVPKSIYYFLPRLSPQKQWSFIFQSFLFLVITGTIVAISIFLFSGLISHFLNNPALNKYLSLFCIYIIFILPLECFVPLMICLEKYKIATFQRILFDIIFLSAVIIPILLGRGLDTIIFTLLISAPFNFIIACAFILREFKFRNYLFDFNQLKLQLSYSLPIGFSSIIIVIMNEFDKVMISYFFPPAIFAIYAIGAREVPFVNNITFSVSGVIQPKLVEYFKQNDMQNFINLCQRAARKTALIIFPIFIFCFITADYIITILFTQQYIDSTIIFRIYLLTLLIRFTSLGPILLAMGFTKEVLESSVLSLTINIVLTILLIKIIGTIGAAIATVLAIYLNFSYLLYKINIRTRLVLKSLIPWIQIIKILIVASICGIILYPLISFLQPSIILLFLLSFVFFGFYVSGGIIFGIIKKAEVTEFLKILRINKKIKFKVFKY